MKRHCSEVNLTMIAMMIAVITLSTLLSAPPAMALGAQPGTEMDSVAAVPFDYPFSESLLDPSTAHAAMRQSDRLKNSQLDPQLDPQFMGRVAVCETSRNGFRVVCFQAPTTKLKNPPSRD